MLALIHQCLADFFPQKISLSLTRLHTFSILLLIQRPALLKFFSHLEALKNPFPANLPRKNQAPDSAFLQGHYPFPVKVLSDD